MKNIKKYFNLRITFILLIAISSITQGSQNPQNRDNLFQQIFDNEKARIIALPEYTQAHNRFMQYLQDIERYKAEKIKEMQQDQEYQKNFATIRKEIQNAGTLHADKLSSAESAQLVVQLQSQFIPQ